LAFYQDKYHIDSFMVMDDTFCIQEKRVEEFCKTLIQRGWHQKLSWWAQTRVDKISPALASLMKEAGCKTLSLGIESGVERILTLIKKEIRLEQARTAVRAVKQAGITARASFILGLPTETLSDSLKTISFALSLPLDFCKFSLATPYPGTELWDIVIKEKGGSLEGRWDDFTQMAGFASSNPLYVPHGRSAGALKNLQKCANVLYYLKPAVLIGMFLRFRRMGCQREFFQTLWTGIKAVVLPGRPKRIH
jgi:anaerobic magnesium-protoporphyrin IX monomethyl ester cyclase